MLPVLLDLFPLLYGVSCMEPELGPSGFLYMFAQDTVFQEGTEVMDMRDPFRF
jgi:hypothetical protein